MLDFFLKILKMYSFLSKTVQIHDQEPFFEDHHSCRLLLKLDLIIFNHPKTDHVRYLF